MISAFDMRLSRWYLRFLSALNVYFAICASKTLQKSSAIQKISVTLSSVIIAKFFSFIVFIHYKVTKNFANYRIFNELYFIELTLGIRCSLTWRTLVACPIRSCCSSHRRYVPCLREGYRTLRFPLPMISNHLSVCNGMYILPPRCQGTHWFSFISG